MKYFTLDEFECPCCKENNINKDLIELLDKAREIAGVSFKINSGYRCTKHNEEVGGKSNSSHTIGLAVDIAVSNSNMRFRILQALLSVGITRIGIAGTFIHADIDTSKAPEVAWVY